MITLSINRIPGDMAGIRNSGTCKVPTVVFGSASFLNPVALPKVYVVRQIYLRKFCIYIHAFHAQILWSQHCIIQQTLSSFFFFCYV